MHRRPRLSAALLAVLALAACTGDDELVPGPDADTAACAAMLERAPETVLGAARGETDVAGVAVWEGEKGRIALRCGVDPLGPTTAPCLEVDGRDWVFVEDGDPFRFQTYGPDPAAEVRVPAEYGREQAPGALTELAAIWPTLASTGRGCD